MKKENSSIKAYERDMLILAMVSENECIPDEPATLDDYDEAIKLYQILLEDAYVRGNKSEIKALRRDLQRAKTEKRLFCNIVAESNFTGGLATA